MPLRVEVLTYAPTEFFHCQHCEVTMQAVGLGQAVRREQRAAAFPPDLQAAYTALGNWVRAVTARYGERVRFRVIDAVSLEGVYKSLRFRVRRYPAFIIAGEVRQGPPDYAALDRWLEGHLGRETPAPGARP